MLTGLTGSIPLGLALILAVIGYFVFRGCASAFALPPPLVEPLADLPRPFAARRHHPTRRDARRAPLDFPSTRSDHHQPHGAAGRSHPCSSEDVGAAENEACDGTESGLDRVRVDYLRVRLYYSLAKRRS